MENPHAVIAPHRKLVIWGIGDVLVMSLNEQLNIQLYDLPPNKTPL